MIRHSGNTVSILGINYNINYVPYIMRDEYRAGQIDFENQEIKILDTLQCDLRNVTLLHEIIHAAMTHLGLHEESQNENLVQGLAIAMHQVIKYHADIFSS